MGINRILKSILEVIRPVNKTVALITYAAPNKRLKGMNIVITGGGRGLGVAMARTKRKYFKRDGKQGRMSISGA